MGITGSEGVKRNEKNNTCPLMEAIWCTRVSLTHDLKISGTSKILNTSFVGSMSHSSLHKCHKESAKRTALHGNLLNLTLSTKCSALQKCDWQKKKKKLGFSFTPVLQV